MIACYDLGRCPPTYDVVAFLALAELERIKRGDAFIDLCVKPGPAGGFRKDHHWPHDIASREKMRDNVLLPLCRLLPSVRSLQVGAPPPGAWGTGEYLVGLPRILETLRAGSQPLRSERAEPARRLITFTLREAEHHTLRNSRGSEWVAASRILAERGWHVVVIRDTHCASEPLEGAETVPLASTDLDTRAAWYASATLNVGISNGPMWMAIFMDAPVLMLRPTTNEALGCYDDRFYAKCGLKRGEQLPNLPSHQRLVWEDDTCENIVMAVEAMVDHI